MRASLRRRLSAKNCETSCERLTCVSFAVFRLLLNASRLLRLTLAMHRLLLNVARLLHLTCRGLHALAAAAGSTSEPSRSVISGASLAWGTHHHVLDLDEFIHELHLSNILDSCDFWKLLQHRVSSTTGHQRSLNVPSCPIFCTFASLAPVVASRQHSFLLRWFLPELWKDQTRSPRAIQ